MPSSGRATPAVVWHILAETSVPVAEFSLALSRLTPVVSWIPEMSWAGSLQRWARSDVRVDPFAPRRIHFSLQRGYARLPRHFSQSTFRNVFATLMAHTASPPDSVLVCTSSFWAQTAALWPGPVVYYATDRTAAYAGLSSAKVIAADRLMCEIADLVCPNSQRLAEYLHQDAGCAGSRMKIVPNATRAANIRTVHCAEREELPEDVPRLPRPIAGVIGNMGDNVDWNLVSKAIEHVPEYHWLFVGQVPTTMLTRRSRRMRAKVLHSARATFLGARPYATLYRYARAFDVAVMPYTGIEPTRSGSSTRFYEHLAAGRPLLSTRGVEELLHKEPLLKLIDNAEELIHALRQLLAAPSDGCEAMRCMVSRSETWELRAASMQHALMQHMFSRLVTEDRPPHIRRAGTVKDGSRTSAER